MRLDKIKLAGFKSFVDPTTVLFPSNLVGVIGPNGCGKSNVIDAVRWVMGESSAKMLRGESMADVIFNGSSSRKPVGTASVELLFDNSDGSAGGQYATYAQISVRRQVSRDGQSQYALNGVRCRRRDIADLFLGTGLGPRSYSIIEQGMISRIIEARPEDLRLYLEEAAGISKYKERRRETERRMVQTRENLARLDDLREEVNKQLQRLEKQAATAEKYRQWRAEERQLKAELLILKLQAQEGERDVQQRRLATQETELQSLLAAQRAVEADVERLRQEQQDASDAVNQRQARFYTVGAEIARLEEALQFARKARRQQERDLAGAEHGERQAEAERATDAAELETFEARLASQRPALAQAQLAAEQAAAAAERHHAELQAWQQRWDAFNATAGEASQRAQVERTRLTQLERQLVQHEQRLQRLRDEADRLDDPKLHREIDELDGARHALEDRVAAAAAALEATMAGLRQDREQLVAAEHRLAEQRTALQTAQGRLAALQALQEAAKGADDKAYNAWLQRHGLDAAPRLLQQLSVPAAWQVAVEQILGGQLAAPCIARLEAGLEGLAAPPRQGTVALLEPGGAATAVPPGSLAAVVDGPAAVREQLALVHTADDLATALARRHDLAPGHWLVTPEGTQVGRRWLLHRSGSGAQQGALAREAEIRDLTDSLAQLQPAVEQAAAALQSGRAALQEAERTRDRQQQSLDGLRREQAELQSRLSGRLARREQMQQRLLALRDEQAEIDGALHEDRAQMNQRRTSLHAALAEVEAASSQRDQLTSERERLQAANGEAQRAAHAARDRAHELALALESAQSRAQALRAAIARTETQLQRAAKRCAALRQALAAGEQPLSEQEQTLERALAERLDAESALAAAREVLSGVEQQARQQDQERQRCAQAGVQARSELEQTRLQHQESQLRVNALMEQFAETGCEREVVAAGLDPQATAADWQRRLETLAQRIQRLGAINLAAIDEYREQQARSGYLDSQHADISESLDTLENAMRKIDRETRARFKDTFERVNEGLQRLFPKLFGGGHAYLELTGEDLLDTGVSVMARPPGKRNASIQLLSGGEKALSAVALVFAIFELNPAPFCMLDEVDAPLDDANVGRYSAMLQEMSDRVQFIFITHNKVTMEIAHHLSGVTMHEPGVSRLVSVDVDEAVALAAAS